MIDGGDGNDRIKPGDGPGDVTWAGAGDDVVDDWDGARDTIHCGSGRDEVWVDRVDRVASDCEVVHVNNDTFP